MSHIIDFKRATKSAEPSPEPLSLTAENSRLRNKRKAAWRTADAVRDYWLARLKFSNAVQRAQNYDVPESREHPAVTDEDRWSLLKSFREALVKQLLTPAPTRADVSWKKAMLAKGQHRHVDCANVRSALVLAGGQHITEAEQLGRLIERAIEDDEAFLTAHPTRPKVQS